MTDGAVDHAQFENDRLESTEIQALQGRIASIIDAACGAKVAIWNEPARLDIMLRDGTVIRRELGTSPGSTLEPLRRDEHIAKFRRWTDGSMTASTQQSLIEATDRMDALRDIDLLTESLRAVRAMTRGSARLQGV